MKIHYQEYGFNRLRYYSEQTDCGILLFSWPLCSDDLTRQAFLKINALRFGQIQFTAPQCKGIFIFDYKEFGDLKDWLVELGALFHQPYVYFASKQSDFHRVNSSHQYENMRGANGRLALKNKDLQSSTMKEETFIRKILNLKSSDPIWIGNTQINNLFIGSPLISTFYKMYSGLAQKVEIPGVKTDEVWNIPEKLKLTWPLRYRPRQ